MQDNKREKRIIGILILTNILAFFISGGLGFKLGRSQLATGSINPESANYREEKLNMVETYIHRNYLRDVDEEKLFEGQLKGMVAALEDPYSNYLTQEELSKLLEDTSGSFGGIGVVVSPGEDGFITVVSPVDDTPGSRAGIRNGDRIVQVDGKDFLAEDMDEAVKLMRGKPGTDVDIKILRGDNRANFEEIDLTLTREEIRTETVDYSFVEDKIAYLRISSFDDKTAEDFRQAMKDLENNGMESLIIDLRNNPGGVLDGTAEIADELLGEGDIVYTENKDGEKRYLKSDKKMIDVPLVILVNGGSASASEILAGAVKDHERGSLVGTKTFGKGVVQRIQDFPDGSGIKLTISEYFTPNGTNIHGIGIEPDYVVELPEDVHIIGIENLEEDSQLQKAIELLK